MTVKHCLTMVYSFYIQAPKFLSPVLNQYSSHDLHRSLRGRLKSLVYAHAVSCDVWEGQSDEACLVL